MCMCIEKLHNVLIALVASAALSGPASGFEATNQYQKLNINGWTVLVSSHFGKSPRERNVILEKIKKQTTLISKNLSAKHLKVLRKAELWIEDGSHYRVLARHHASKSEIYQEGLNTAKYRDVEIFGRFASIRQPTLVLHELAHVYHDRKLAWNDRKIKRLHAQFEARMPSAKDRCGRPTKAYALKNHNEFFATFTEAYFGKTCSYPFDRTTIQNRHPEMFALLKKVWGQ